MICFQQAELEIAYEISRHRPLHINPESPGIHSLLNRAAQRAAAQYLLAVKRSGGIKRQTICESPARIDPDLPALRFFWFAFAIHFVFVELVVPSCYPASLLLFFVSMLAKNVLRIHGIHPALRYRANGRLACAPAERKRMSRSRRKIYPRCLK
jgi:hypothetical protein